MLASDRNIKVYKAMNSSKGSRRYIETLWRLVKTRFKNHPDVYILGFRGAEIFLLVRLITIGKPLIYDEFINPYLWMVEEHKKVKKGSILASLIKIYANICLRLSQHVLSDTKLHATYSSNLSGLPLNKFTPLYVGTNEELFKPQKSKNKITKNFEVLYYCSRFLPLHGVDVVLDAAGKLKKEPIYFTIIGGKDRLRSIEKLKEKITKLDLNNVTHKSWVPYEDLHNYIAKADLCLGGPFGNTSQGRLVITGKTFQFLAMSKPTVIGKIDEDDGFVDRENCLLVDQGDADQLAESIRWASKNPEQTQIIGMSGLVLYENHFSVESQADKLLENVSSV
jgi:glycosyltransferase involved in cell wall biosynthesis